MKFLADMGISLRTVAWLRDAVVHECEEYLETGVIISVSNETYRVRQLPI